MWPRETPVRSSLSPRRDRRGFCGLSLGMNAWVQDNRSLSRVHSCLPINIINEHKGFPHISVVFREWIEEDFGSQEKFSRWGRYQNPSRSRRRPKIEKYTPCLRRVPPKIQTARKPATYGRIAGCPSLKCQKPEIQIDKSGFSVAESR